MVACRYCGRERLIAQGDCEHCGSPPLPEDFEPCGECGFDHEYEFVEAYRWHEAQCFDVDTEATEGDVGF